MTEPAMLEGCLETPATRPGVCRKVLREDDAGGKQAGIDTAGPRDSPLCYTQGQSELGQLMAEEAASENLCPRFSEGPVYAVPDL